MCADESQARSVLYRLGAWEGVDTCERVLLLGVCLRWSRAAAAMTRSNPIRRPAENPERAEPSRAAPAVRAARARAVRAAAAEAQLEDPLAARAAEPPATRAEDQPAA